MNMYQASSQMQRMIFPLFLSTLENLSVNPIHSHRNSIVASQLTCLMLHCSGHFLQTFCSVSHLLYLYKFLPCSFLDQNFNSFITKKISTFFPLSPILQTLSFQSFSGIFSENPRAPLVFQILARYDLVSEEIQVLM